MTDSDYGPTLRDALLGKQLQGSHMKFSMIEGLKASGALDNLLGMSNHLNEIARIGAQQSALSKKLMIDAAGLNTAASSISKAAAAALLPLQQPRTLEMFRLLADDGAFRIKQQQMILSLLPKTSTSGFFTTSAAMRAVAIAAAAPRAATPAADVDEPVAGRSYGSHQLTPGQTAQIAATIWAIVQVHLQDGSDKNLVQSYLLTLCLVTMIWCALAAAP